MAETRNQSVQSDSAGPAALSAGLARCLAKEKANSNLVFSPLSIYVALGLLAAGARGATKDEILGVLGAQSRRKLKKFISRLATDTLTDQSGSGGPRVAFACGVWSDLTCSLKAANRSTVVDNSRPRRATSTSSTTRMRHGDRSMRGLTMPRAI
jgi:serine protease inhibitor